MKRGRVVKVRESPPVSQDSVEGKGMKEPPKLRTQWCFRARCLFILPDTKVQRRRGRYAEVCLDCGKVRADLGQAFAGQVQEGERQCF